MPPMKPTVSSVNILDGYTLQLEFSNGEKGVLDMEPYLDFGLFKKLRNPSEFNKVSVKFGTLEWDSGSDLDPEFIYEKARKPVPV